MAEWKTCTVGWVGPAANSTDGPNPVVYIGLAPNDNSFDECWFFAADNAKTEMLAVALAARSLNRPVWAAIDPPNLPAYTPYTEIYRLYMT
jgi:uncharacterized membrane protein